jgi:hypothetical protein
VEYVLARLIVLLRVVNWRRQMPLKLFPIHAGHGLANDLVIAAIVGGWSLKTRPRDAARGAENRLVSAGTGGALQG